MSLPVILCSACPCVLYIRIRVCMYLCSCSFFCDIHTQTCVQTKGVAMNLNIYIYINRPYKRAMLREKEITEIRVGVSEA